MKRGSGDFGDKQYILRFNKREAAGFTVPVDTAGGFSLGQDECEGMDGAEMGSRNFQKFVILRAFFEEHFSLSGRFSGILSLGRQVHFAEKMSTSV